MRRFVPLLLTATLLAGVARAGDAPDPPNGVDRQKRIDEARKAKIEADKRFAEAVNAAIDKGGAWLRSQQLSDGSWPPLMPGARFRQELGLSALCLLALAKGGADANDATMKKGLKRMREMYDGSPPTGWNLKGSSSLMTYSVATMVLLYDALYGPGEGGPKDDPKAKPAKKAKIPKEVESTIKDLVDWLAVAQEDGVWRYPGGLEGKEDLSHAQYVLLALQAAARCGVEVRSIVYAKALAYVLDHQTATGPEVQRLVPNPAYEPGGDDRYGPFLRGPKDHARGWSYLPNLVFVTGGTTAAGLVCLAVAKDRLRAADKLDKETERRIDRSMLDGMAWMASKWSVVTNPGTADSGWHFAYLYTLERAGTLLAMSHFGQHDWYREGAEFLLEKQAQDGGWAAATTDVNKSFEPRVVQSCFALLFLERATIPPDKPVGPVLTGD